MKKMNNKGFSLVELIVVVLIMAIIAVALAPQVMKWVENSRKSTDCNNYDSVVSAANLALGNENVMKDLPSGGWTLNWPASTGSSWSADGTNNSVLTNEMANILGTGWMDKLVVKRTTFTNSGAVGGNWTITISGNGTVERTAEPSAKDVS